MQTCWRHRNVCNIHIHIHCRQWWNKAVTTKWRMNIQAEPKHNGMYMIFLYRCKLVYVLVS
jgi:hypothetical protein